MSIILFIILLIILFYYILKIKIKKENFNQNICNGFSCENDNCSIQDISKYCNDEDKRVLFNDTPNCYYDKVVDPNNLECIDFCVKTYTWKPLSFDNMGTPISSQFIGSKKQNYFSSKCNECIDNHYNRIMLLTDNNIS